MTPSPHLDLTGPTGPVGKVTVQMSTTQHRSQQPGTVSLRRETFDEAIGILRLLSQMHMYDERTGKCQEPCDACSAEKVIAEMEQQAQ